MAYYGDGSNITGIVDTGARDDIALLGFKVAANGSLARYNLVDQSIDAFEDASGVDASGSTAEVRSDSNYYYGGSVVTPTVTGGTITTDGDYKIHSFTASADYVTDYAQTVDYLIVAGGGSGGGSYAGGGGAGGFRYLTGQSLASGTFGVVVGAGSTYTGGSVGTDGNDSSINSLSATGGGGGGATTTAGRTGAGGAGGSGGGGGSVAGGSGGGGSNQPTNTNGAGNAGGYDPVEGYIGGYGLYSGNYPGGGGGGSSEAGHDHAGSTTGGAGGDGTANSITGASVTYAGGGGGSANDQGGAVGGAGGAGTNGSGGNGGNGTDGLGAGGGGGGYYIQGAGTGGDGIVIVRRPTTTTTEGSDMTLVSNAQTAESVPTNGDLVMTITNGAGTTTPNTDIKAYIARDGSDYTTAVTLVDQGDTGGHTILTANLVDLSGETSGTSMRWKITTHNQSASKTTRIQAVSLGWS